MLRLKNVCFAMLTLAGLMFSACGNGGLKEVVQNHFNALNRHDIKALVAGYHANVEVTSSGTEGISKGVTAIQNAYTGYFKTSPDLKYDVANVYYSNDGIVTVEYTASGTIKSGEASMVGKHYIIKYCVILTVKDGKITKEATYFDQVSFLKQMGFFDTK